MATLTLHDLADDIRDKLRERASVHGRSIEAEAIEVLKTALPLKPVAMPEAELREAVHSAQQFFAQYVPPGSYTVDDFLRERREEQAMSDARFERLAVEGRQKPRSGR